MSPIDTVSDSFCLNVISFFRFIILYLLLNFFFQLPIDFYFKIKYF